MDLLIQGGALLLTAVGSVGLFVIVTRVDQAVTTTKQDAILAAQSSILEKQEAMLESEALHAQDIAVLKVEVNHLKGWMKNANA